VRHTHANLLNPCVPVLHTCRCICGCGCGCACGCVCGCGCVCICVFVCLCVCVFVCLCAPSASCRLCHVVQFTPTSYAFYLKHLLFADCKLQLSRYSNPIAGDELYRLRASTSRGACAMSTYAVYGSTSPAGCCCCAYQSYRFQSSSEGDPMGWSTVLVTALGSWGKLVPRGKILSNITNGCGGWCCWNTAHHTHSLKGYCKLPDTTCATV
jgi:hypothetical protein